MDDLDKERLHEEIELALHEKEYKKAKQKTSEPGQEKKSRGPRSSEFVPSFDQTSKKSHYEILGTDPKASSGEIKRAYRQLMFKYHPDLGLDVEEGDTPDTIIRKTQDKANRTVWSKRIQEAYDTLSDTEKRTLYDTYGDDPSKEGPVGKNPPLSKTAIKFWEGVFQGKSPIESFSPGMGRYEYALGPGVFRFRNLDVPSGKKAFMEYMTEFDKEQDRLDRSPICACKEPVFPRGYRVKGGGKDTCMYCGKKVIPGSKPPSYSESSRTPDIKGLGPGMGKVR